MRASLRSSKLPAAVALCLLGVLLEPGAAAAQATCELQPSPGSEAVVYNQGTPFQVAHMRRPILSCTNGMRITADSAVDTRAIAEIQFIGAVRFSDPEQRLNADFVQYLTAQRHIAAQGNVVLVDLVNGSTIRAPALDYLMESPERPESRIEVYSGRPRTVLVSARQGAPADTTLVDSDALSIIGDHTFIGRGNVVLTRGELEGRGSLLDYSQTTGTMQLSGSARLNTAEYRLAGDTVTAEMETDTLRQVVALGGATLETDDVNVDAPAIRIGFEAGELHRLVALGASRTGPSSPAAAAMAAAQGRAPGGQARVVSPDFRIIADSIDALAPMRQLERVVAVGAAFGERLPTDSVARMEADTLPDFIAHDWVRGDTIVAVFAAETTGAEPVAVAAVGTAGQERALESLTVHGGEQPASSAYRMRDEADPAGMFTINYLLAREIRVAFVTGEVRRVEAEGDVQGIYLRPTAAVNAAAPPAGGRRR
jgi:lipopolysaccharide export system protein LptA